MVTVRTLGEYALWLVPKGEASTQLERVIKDVARSHPGSPAFDPHITLWYPIANTTILEEITADLRTIFAQVSQTHDLANLSLELNEPESGGFYYQCVLSPVTPTPTLLALRKAVEEKWGPANKTYFPHLSLMYGDLETEKKDAIAKGISKSSIPTRVDVDQMLVIDTQGAADEWKVAARVPLS